MSAAISIKQGDTLSIVGLYQASDGSNVDLTSYTVTSSVRYGGASIATLTVTKANQSSSTGQFTLSATASATAAWPLGASVCDVKFVDGSGNVTHGDTFVINVLSAVTP